MKEQDPEGYSQRQTNATRKANEIMKKEGKGVWSKEQHIQAENTKRKNGTDFGNQEFRKKIGCNGNSQEIISKQKELGIGIFRTDIHNNHKPGNCTQCKKFCKHRNAFGIGVECGCLKKLGFQPNFITKDNVRYYKGIEINEFVQKILNYELDINNYPSINIRCGKVCYGTEDLLTSDKIYQNSNFTEVDNVRYYKGIEVNDFAKKILSGELDINKYPKINIRFSRVCYGTEDIITSEKLIKNNSNFEEKDEVLYFYDKSVQDYIPWEKYKLKFSRMHTTSEINHFIEKLKSLDIFQSKYMGKIGSYDLNDIVKLYPTFRSQESETWENGSKSAFEQSLVDADIHWFTYIKFYIDRNDNIHPLVVGKSGSLNVNNNGSDVSFSTDINDGPARKFLNDENLQWDKTQILIIKAKSERQALFYEWKIADVYELFES